MLADRVRETTATTGTGTITLNGALAGFQSFNAAFGTNAQLFYVIDGGQEWEVGNGHLSSSTTLVRDQVLANSDGNTSLHNFSAGTKFVYCDAPAEYLEQALVSDVDGATITFDMSKGNKHTVVLGGNRTLAVSNVKVGQRFLIKLIQDGSGSRTVTWFTTIKWPGGTAPTLTTTLNKADWFGFICTSGGQFDGFTLGLNF